MRLLLCDLQNRKDFFLPKSTASTVYPTRDNANQITLCIAPDLASSLHNYIEFL